MVSALEQGADQVERLAAVGQEQLIDVVAAHSEVPTATIEALVDWLVRHVDHGDGYAVNAPDPGGYRSIVGRADEERVAEIGDSLLGEKLRAVPFTRTSDGMTLGEPAVPALAIPAFASWRWLPRFWFWRSSRA